MRMYVWFQGVTMRKVAAAALIAVLLAGAGTTARAAGGETISMAMLAGYKEDVLRANIASFQSATGITVQIDSSPYDDLYKKTLLSLSTSARRYDVMFMDEPWIPALSAFLVPLDDAAKRLDMNDFVPSTVQGGRYKGKLYALPVDPNVLLFIYRKDIFDRRGLKVPDTWDEVLRTAQALNDPANGMAGIALAAGGADTQTGLYMLLLVWSYGGDVLGNDGKAALETAAAQRGADAYLRLLQYAPAGVRSYGFGDINKAVQLGKAMMAVQWASGARPMEDPKNSTVAGKLGYAAVPKGTVRAPMRGVWTIGIAQTSQHRDAAWKFVEWITGREFGRAAALYPATSSAIHSPRLSVLRDPEVTKTLPYAPALLANLRIAHERARIPQWPDIQDALRQGVAKISTGGTGLADGLKELDTTINRIMEK
jgi:multiple sugar transport system substrate-binding protein/sorbitol/mannitol transport system substrate-binding protein